jgi:signal transduction histidine kinase/DNA-binding response OmpR family regulator
MASEKATILLVEDDPGVARLERLRLERAGYAVASAASAEEALQRLREQPVSLLVLDQRLASGLSGLDLYEQVKAAGHDLPAILVTALQEDGLLLRALRAGVRDFVPKSPEFLDYLAPAVAQVLRQVATERQLATERRQASRARAVASAALRIHAAQSPESVLQAVTEEACRILRAQHACSRLRGTKVRTAWAVWKDDGEKPYTGMQADSGPIASVCQSNQPLRLTAAEWKTRSDLAQPALANWLGAPFVGREGRNLGLIQLANKEEGDFTEEDEAVLVQLASLAAVALENARLLEELRQADRRKDEFLAMLAHELRNPLAPLRNALEVVRLRGSERRQAVRQSWDMIERQIGHLTRLVDDLLDVSRITGGKITLKKEIIEVAEVVRRAVETSRPLIEARKHRLEVRLPPAPLYLDGDLTRLAQVLLNLLNNAAKYTEEGGRITLSVETVAAPSSSPEILLRVRDTGVGIPPDILPKVFDLFTQADRTLDRSQGGLGIGLTLVRRLVAMHGGSVSAFSAGPGTGSEFVVRLPLYGDPVPAAHGDGHEVQVRMLPHRILVVDDNRDSALSLAMLLQLAGNEVETAHDGPDALQAAGRFHPDVALLDIGLPRMDGYELARRLRRLPGLKRVRLAALTGYGSEEDRRRSREAGFNYHLVKPIEMETLQTLLANLPAADLAKR